MSTVAFLNPLFNDNLSCTNNHPIPIPMISSVMYIEHLHAIVSYATWRMSSKILGKRKLPFKYLNSTICYIPYIKCMSLFFQLDELFVFVERGIPSWRNERKTWYISQKRYKAIQRNTHEKLEGKSHKKNW